MMTRRLELLSFIFFLAIDCAVGVLGDCIPQEVESAHDFDSLDAKVVALASSRENDGVAWLIAEADGKWLLQGISTSDLNPAATFQLTIPMEESGFVSIQDIAVGPGPLAGKPYIYLFDKREENIRLFRVLEPLLFRDDNPHELLKAKSSLHVDILTLSCPTRFIEAKTLLLDPISGEIVVLANDETNGVENIIGIYATQQNLAFAYGSSSTALEFRGSMNFGSTNSSARILITSGDISRDGRLVLIQSEGGKVYYFNRLPYSLLSEALVDQRGAPGCLEPQHEIPDDAVALAVAYDDGDGYFQLHRVATTIYRLGHYFWSTEGHGAAIFRRATAADDASASGSTSVAIPIQPSPQTTSTSQSPAVPGRPGPLVISIPHSPAPLAKEPTSTPTIIANASQPVSSTISYNHSSWNTSIQVDQYGDMNNTHHASNVSSWNITSTNASDMHSSDTVSTLESYMAHSSQALTPRPPPSAATSSAQLPLSSSAIGPSSAPSVSPSSTPSISSTFPPSAAPSGPTEYIPGLLTHIENGLLLSSGLRCRIVATSGQRVQYRNGDLSSRSFHGQPDFGATFVDTREGNEGGWVYVSNSEQSDGGVGAVTFDYDGNVLNYDMVLTGTSDNCGGGKTPFDTWISCEETQGGRNYQVDPLGRRRSEAITLGQDGGNFESFAYDVRDPYVPQFFVTEDASNGALRRFIPTDPSRSRHLSIENDKSFINKSNRTLDSKNYQNRSRRTAEMPTGQPSLGPSEVPTLLSTQEPISEPSRQPTETPSTRPSASLSSSPTVEPSDKPSENPSARPSTIPLKPPTNVVSEPPNQNSFPSAIPTANPSTSPTNYVYDYYWDLYDEDAWMMLHGPGRTYYLILEPTSGRSRGTFRWSTDIQEGRQNAAEFYPNAEGIDVHDGVLYFVCKSIKWMFELDLDAGTYRGQSTRSGLFDGQPDQLQKILFDTTEELLFFTEEGGDDAGIHARDASGVFYTLLEGPDYPDETTGLAFSPDFMHLYVAYQDAGLLFDVYRFDGLPFSATSLNLKSHATGDK